MLNRQVPEVRILLLPLIRLVSSVGSEHDATNVGVGSSNISRVAQSEIWQSWLIAPVLKTGRRQRLKGSNPLVSAELLHGVMVSTADPDSARGGSNPSEATTFGSAPAATRADCKSAVF